MGHLYIHALNHVSSTWRQQWNVSHVTTTPKMKGIPSSKLLAMATRPRRYFVWRWFGGSWFVKVPVFSRFFSGPWCSKCPKRRCLYSFQNYPLKKRVRAYWGYQATEIYFFGDTHIYMDIFINTTYLGGGFKYFQPDPWGNDRLWLWLMFFKWVETTNYRYYNICLFPGNSAWFEKVTFLNWKIQSSLRFTSKKNVPTSWVPKYRELFWFISSHWLYELLSVFVCWGF